MKKTIAQLLLAFFILMNATFVMAQDKKPEEKTTEKPAEEKPVEEKPAQEEKKADEKPTEETAKVPNATFHQVIKQKFIEGDWIYMTPVIICLILGLAIALERVITLNLASTNTKKFEKKIEEALKNGGIDAAKQIAVNTRGPVASIYAQGLIRNSEGLDMVEKSVVSYGSVEMGRLEQGLVWISLFIALAPMLGFLGTVVGMIQAFDMIQAAGDISPTIVAGGIKVALLTTVAGLIVAIILQILYNYITSKVSSIVSQMEDSSISLIDMLVVYNRK
ncbi:MAG: MotA/TolQ/ExbB proton channel family protein [Bacteroidetes bacterium]|nr:MAG: MotA/TolQ/ExbB proton channel family protein [Bacteroidota bacterium]TAG86910.1 MAG: MotA/TolQ/ExbB proton channel family protein [Bacteroidota bacterium]